MTPVPPATMKKTAPPPTAKTAETQKRRREEKIFSPGGIEIIYAPGGFTVERGGPYLLPEKKYEVVVRDCGVGTKTPLFLESSEEEREYVPASHFATPSTSSTTTDNLPPAKKKRKRGKRMKGRSETAPDPDAAPPIPSPQEVERRQAQARRSFQARRAGREANVNAASVPPPSQVTTPVATAAAGTQPARRRHPVKDRLGPSKSSRPQHLRPGQKAGLAAAAALEAADPGRAARVTARWQEAMRRKEAPPTTTPPTLPPPPLAKTNRRPDFPHGAIRKPWKLHYANEDLKEAEAKEAANPGYYGREIEEIRRWIVAIERNEDSDSTDDDYRPPLERSARRKEKEGEDELMGWESEAPFPKDNEPADYIDINDILI